MEKKPQADSPRKSPVPKSPLPEEDGKVGGVNGTAAVQTLESKDLKSSPYQDSKTIAKEDDKKPVESIQNLDKKEIVADNLLATDEKSSHSIISVDIQKSTPCDKKESVPHGTKQDSTDDIDVPPELLAALVTNAIVIEATVTVSESNGITINGSSVTKVSSKVDAAVEQELNKVSDTKNATTDVKSVEGSNGNTKPMPNGDIDHSPVRDAADNNLVSDRDNLQKDSELSLKDKLLPREEKTSNDLDQASKPKDYDLNAESKIGEKIEQIEIGSCNGVPGIITVESITKKETISNSSESLKTIDPKEETMESKSIDPDFDKDTAKDSIKNNGFEVSKSEESASAETDDNLTDSAKLRNGNLTDSGKTQSVSESKSTVSAGTCLITNNDKEANAVQKSIDVQVVSKDRSEKANNITETKDTKETASSALQPSETIKTDGKSGISDQPSTKCTETIQDISGKDKTEVKTDAKKQIEDTVNKQKSEEEDVKESKKDSKGVVANDKSVKVEEKRSVPCEEICDMTAMMTSQILTAADLGIEESVEVQNVDSKDSTKEESSISATVLNGKTCDVAVGLEQRKMAPVAGPDGEEEEIDGRQASAEVEVTDDATGMNSLTSSEKSSLSSKPQSATSQKDGQEVKPASAASRTSIPEPIVYEPPERRKSATSESGDSKKDFEENKSQLDDKQSKKEKIEKGDEDTGKKPPVTSESHKKEADNKLQEENNTGKVKDSDSDKEKEKEKETVFGKTTSDDEQTIDVKSQKQKASTADKETSKEKDKEPDNAEKGNHKNEDLETPPAEIKVDGKKDSNQTEVSVSKNDSSKEGQVDKKTLKEIADDSKDEDTSLGQEKGEGDFSEKEGSQENILNSENIKENGVESKPEVSEMQKDITSKENTHLKAKIDDNSKTGEKTNCISEQENLKSPEPSGKSPEPSEKSLETASKSPEPSEHEHATKSPEPIETTSEPISKSPEPTSKSPELTIKTPEPISKSPESVKDELAEDKQGNETEALEKETEVASAESSKVELEKETDAEIQAEDSNKESVEVAENGKDDVKTSEEPKTLIEEAKEISVKETAEAEEKESDDTEKEATPDEEVKKDNHLVEEKDDEIVEEKCEDKETESKVAKDEATKEKEIETEIEDENKLAEKEEPGAEIIDDAKPKDGRDKTEPAETEEKEKAEEDARIKESERKPDSPPKSPTKRSGSPTKGGRRGISPLSSPPKVLKPPTSPQKPLKTSSPKKRNDMLSPIKTPKTPGSDGRKLPPIKATVGLAPNPNLKNIRSKIGSFDNIRYKPGGGDKKVISKKLEWKAAPKIGSLDHSFKKLGKRSKSESQEGKVAEGQSPLPSGDEADAEGTTSGIVETIIKPDATESTEMPSVITAES